LLQGDRIKTWAEARKLLGDAYNTRYGIFDHIQQEALDDNPAVDPSLKRPFASFEIHPAEEYTEHSQLFKLLDVFPNKKIGELYNISFLDFINCPPEVVEKMIAVCDKIMSSKEAKGREVLDNLKDSMKDLES